MRISHPLPDTPSSSLLSLSRYHRGDALFIPSFLHHSFIPSFLHHSFIPSFLHHSFIIPSSLHSFIPSFLHHPFIPSFLQHSFIPSFLHSFIPSSFLHSFIIPSSLHPSIPPSIPLFLPSSPHLTQYLIFQSCPWNRCYMKRIRKRPCTSGIVPAVCGGARMIRDCWW